MSEFNLEDFGFSDTEQFLAMVEVGKDSLESIEKVKELVSMLVEVMKMQEDLLTSANKIRAVQEQLIDVQKQQIEILKLTRS